MVFSLLIIYLEGLGKWFQVGVDPPPLSILRNSRWMPIMKKVLLYNYEIYITYVEKE